MINTSGWDEWGRHVLSELERQSCLIEKLSEKMDEKEEKDNERWYKKEEKDNEKWKEMAVSITKQEVQNSRQTKFYSFLGSAIAVLIAVALSFL